jgi:hypothetical protein
MVVKEIKEVLSKHSEDLMAIPSVVAVGQGAYNGSPCIKIFVSKKTTKLEEKIPKNLEGYPVIIEETGEIWALKKNSK